MPVCRFTKDCALLDFVQLDFALLDFAQLEFALLDFAQPERGQMKISVHACVPLLDPPERAAIIQSQV